MNVQRDPDAILAAWLEEGPARLPDQTRRAIVVATRTTSQRRPAVRPPWRSDLMPLPSKILGAAAALAVVLIAGAWLLGPRSDQSRVGGPSVPSPTPSATIVPSASPTAAVATPIDTAAWTTYTSSQYGFTIGHPAGWTEVPASRPWTFEADNDDWLSPGMDAFFNPVGEGVRVSAWRVALDPGTIVTWESSEVEAWYEEVYCPKTGGTSCAGIHARAVPLCLEVRDCHPGILLPSLVSDVQAFFSSTNEDGMIVVSVWRAENDPSVARYGGSRRLLEAFLSTMCVWPKDARPAPPGSCAGDPGAPPVPTTGP